MNLDKDTVEIVNEIRQAIGRQDRREIILKTQIGDYIFNDSAEKYERLIPYLDRSVSNVESFASYVIEYCNREENSDGHEVAVLFSMHGATCYPQDGLLQDKISYARKKSQQWEQIEKLLDREMTHKELLRAFQLLKPSIGGGYADLTNQYKKITFDDKVSVTSQPIVENGSAGAAISFNYSVASGGQSQTKLPSEFTLTLQFAWGSSRYYDLDIEIDPSLVKDKNENTIIKFTLIAPQIENLKMQAINDEISDFIKETSEFGLEKILCVHSF